MLSYIFCAAVLPNYDQCLDAGKQIITAELGYISSAMRRRHGDRSAGGVGSRGGVAVLAHGAATTTTSTTGISSLTDSVPPCPIELVAEPGQRINFTLFDFAPRNVSYPNTASQVDYDDGNLSKMCHRFGSFALRDYYLIE